MEFVDKLPIPVVILGSVSIALMVAGVLAGINKYILGPLLRPLHRLHGNAIYHWFSWILLCVLVVAVCIAVVYFATTIPIDYAVQATPQANFFSRP